MNELKKINVYSETFIWIWKFYDEYVQSSNSD